MKTTHRGRPLTTEERAELARQIDAEGLASLRERTGLSRTALLNAAIGLPVIAGTRALVREALEDAGDEHGDEPDDGDDRDDDEVDIDGDDDEDDDDQA